MPIEAGMPTTPPRLNAGIRPHTAPSLSTLKLQLYSCSPPFDAGLTIRLAADRTRSLLATSLARPPLL